VRKGQLESSLLVLTTLGLVAFGLVMVYSATSAPAALGDSDPGYYLKRQAVYALLGIGLMVAISRTSFRRFREFAPLLVMGALALLLVVLVVGDPVNGARRWITFGPAVFQPSELAKLALCVWAAAYLARRRAPQTLGELARPFGLLVGIFFALLLAEPDLGTSITIVLMLAGVLLVAGTPVRVLGTGAALAAGTALVAIAIEPYRRERLLSFLDPWSDADGAGFQTVQALIGLGSGGVLGRGLGESVVKNFYLPEAHTDMIFAIIGEELGLVGTLLVVGGFVLFAYAGFCVALACGDPFGKLLAAGLTALICGQALINLAAVLGLAPLTGIPLPFVSAGGSSLVIALTSVGVLLNIASDDARAAPARVPDRRRRDGRARAAGARRGRGARGKRSTRDVRRVAEAIRGAARS
jgi:cell division protein FtsW